MRKTLPIVLFALLALVQGQEDPPPEDASSENTPPPEGEEGQPPAEGEDGEPIEEEVKEFLYSNWEIAKAKWDFDYANNGHDWESLKVPSEIEGLENHCGNLDFQSPVNLMLPLGSYGWAYGEIIPVEGDHHQSFYANSIATVESNWQQQQLQVEVPITEEGRPENFFESHFPQKFYNETKAMKYKPTHFVVHSPSEHTVNGNYMDIEVQIHHTSGDAGAKLPKAVVSVLFSKDYHNAKISTDQNQTIQAFFNNLELDSDHVATPESSISALNFGDLMSLLSFKHRWIYKGSDTLPPCQQNVYWNVLHDIYPVTKQIVDRLADKMQMHKPDFGSKTNSRMIFPVKKHQIYFIGATGLKGLALASAVVISSLIF